MKHCKDCIHADKGAKEHPCNDCAQLKQGGGVDMTRYEKAPTSGADNNHPKSL